MTAEDHALVSAAVAEAERSTDAEIVTIVAARSDHYADVPLLWAGGVTLLALSLIAAFPALHDRLLGLWGNGGWATEPSPLLPIFMLATVLFVAVWLALQWMPLRLRLTPRDIKARRTRSRAMDLFRATTQGRTQGDTGVLIYLSLGEHRAEIIADTAVAAKVAPDVWGGIMAGLIDNVRQGRVASGLAAAVREAGQVLAVHTPRRDDNPNELRDRLIEI